MQHEFEHRVFSQHAPTRLSLLVANCCQLAGQLAIDIYFLISIFIFYNVVLFACYFCNHALNKSLNVFCI